MVIRVGRRDLVYAIIWILAWGLPLFGVLQVSNLSTAMQVPAALALTALLATVPGAAFTMWYVGRRKQP
jgi:hypothetical protein